LESKIRTTYCPINQKLIPTKKNLIFRVVQGFPDKDPWWAKNHNLLYISTLRALSGFRLVLIKKFSYPGNISIDKNTVKMVS